MFSSEFDDVTITSDGIVNIYQGEGRLPVGQINLLRASQQPVIESVGHNHFRLLDHDGFGLTEAEIFQNTADNDRLIQSKVLAQSNVNLSEEMTEMILTQRSYQFNARTISMADQMPGLVNQLR